MARKHRHEEHENHERWLVSYADFITLLFAFFVVMYSISSINEGKYRVLSESLEEAFNESPLRSVNPIEVGDLARSPKPDPMTPRATTEAPTPPIDLIGMEPATTPVEPEQRADSSRTEQAEPSTLKDLDTVAEEVTRALAPLIDAALIVVHKKDHWVEIEMKSNILFDSGSAQLVSEAIPVLQRFAEVLRGFGNPVQVEGFTDNQPISTPVFPSNWELSAARAASVVHLFGRLGVDPARMAAIGYGEHRPVADNATYKGRQKNRRVVILITANGDTRQIAAIDRVAEAAGPNPAGESRLQAESGTAAHSPLPASR